MHRKAHLIWALALAAGIFSVPADAQPVWQLTDVTRFISLPQDVMIPLPAATFAGQLALDGSSVLAMAAWTEDDPDRWVDYQGLWSTSVGTGVNVLKLDESCIQGTDIGGSSISCGRVPDALPDPRGGDSSRTGNGLEGDWITGQNMLGIASSAYVNEVILNGTGLAVGDTLKIIRRTLAIDPCTDCFGPLPMELVLTYTLVPLPPAMWLFVGAIGALLLTRRRRTHSSSPRYRPECVRVGGTC